MLDKDLLSTCAPLGTLCSKTNEWRARGAGVFIFDDPFIWYVTAEHLTANKESHPIHILINHAKSKQYLVNIDSLHKQHKMDWIVDKKNDLAATLFPADPNFELKAINFSLFMNSKEMLPSMSCYSVGCPYNLAGFDMERVNPCVLDGIISGIDRQRGRIWVTVPTFPGNSGGPLFVWKQPIQANGDVNLGRTVAHLGGIISEYVLVGDGNSETDNRMCLPPLHLGVVIPTESIQALLNTEEALGLKKRTMKS